MNRVKRSMQFVVLSTQIPRAAAVLHAHPTQSMKIQSLKQTLLCLIAGTVESLRSRSRPVVFKAMLIAGLAGAASSSMAQFVSTAKMPSAGNAGGVGGFLVTNSPGNYTVVGGGNDIWDAADDFTFHYFPVSGDFDVRVRVES